MATRFAPLPTLPGGLMGILTPEEEEAERLRIEALLAEADIDEYLAAHPEEIAAGVANAELPPTEFEVDTASQMPLVDPPGWRPPTEVAEEEEPAIIEDDEPPVATEEKRSPSGKRGVVIIEDDIPPPAEAKSAVIEDDVPLGRTDATILAASEALQGKKFTDAEFQEQYENLVHAAINSPEWEDASAKEMRQMANRLAKDLFGDKVNSTFRYPKDYSDAKLAGRDQFQAIAEYRKGRADPAPSSIIEDEGPPPPPAPDVPILEQFRDAGQTAIAGLVKGTGSALTGTAEGMDAITRRVRDLASRVGAEKAFDILMAPPGEKSMSDAFRQLGQPFKGVGERIDIAEERRNTVPNIVAGALGQVTGQIAITMAGGSIAGSVAYLGQSFDQIAEAVKQSGKQGTAEGDYATIIAGPVMASLEKLGIDRLLNRVPPEIRNRFIRGMADVTMAGGIEAAEEVAESFVQNLAVKLSVKEDQSLTEGFNEAAIGGGGAGAIIRVLVGGKARRFSREEIEEAIEEANNSVPPGDQGLPATADQGAYYPDGASQTPQDGQSDPTVIEDARPVVRPPAARSEPPVRVRATPAPVDEAGREQPIVLPKGTITSRQGRRASFRTANGAMASREHKGVDIAIAGGAKAKVGVIADGVVVQNRVAGGYGNQVTVRHSDGTYSTYSHLSSFGAKVGQVVKQGQPIGNQGKTGNATGYHVHIERRTAKGEVLNVENGRPVQTMVAADGTVTDDTGHPPSKQPEVEDDGFWEDRAKRRQAEDTYTRFTGQRFAEDEAEAAPAPPASTPLAKNDVIPTALRESPAAGPDLVAMEREASLAEASTRNPARAKLAEIQTESSVDWSQPQPGEQPMYAQDANGVATPEVAGYTDPTGAFRLIGEPSTVEVEASRADPVEVADAPPVATPAPQETTVQSVGELPLEVETPQIDRAAVMASLPSPTTKNPDALAGRNEGRRVGVGMVEPLTPEQLAEMPKSFVTNYNLGAKEAAKALAEVEVAGGDMTTSAPLADLPAQDFVAQVSSDTLDTTPVSTESSPVAGPVTLSVQSKVYDDPAYVPTPQEMEAMEAEALEAETATEPLATERAPTAAPTAPVTAAVFEKMAASPAYTPTEEEAAAMTAEAEAFDAVGLPALEEAAVPAAGPAPAPLPRPAALAERVDKIEAKLWDLSVAGNVGDVKRYAQALMREGVLERGDFDALSPMLSDKNTTAEVATQELGGYVDSWADRQAAPAGTVATRNTKKRAGRKVPKPTDLRDTIPGYAKVAKWLTGIDEIAKVKRAAALKLASLWENLPSSTEIAAVAISGRAAGGWYANSANAIVQVFGQSSGIRFAALLAATSPKNPVPVNLYNSLKIWTAWNDAGRPTDRASIVRIMGQSVAGSRGEASVMGNWINNSVRALTEPTDQLVLSGPKVNSFFQNLIGEVNEVTNDTWMARFLGKKQSSLEIKDRKTGRRVKSVTYMAFNAKMREAAKVATQRTGQTWTPVEIQEAVWAWTKAVYEMRDRAGENRTINDILSAGGLTHEMMSDTENFSTLLTQNIFANILEEAGYGQQTRELARSLERDRPTAPVGGGVGSVTDAEGTGFTQPAFEKNLKAAGTRLEKSRPEPEPKRLKKQAGAPQPQPSLEQVPFNPDTFPDAQPYYGEFVDDQNNAAFVDGSATLLGENDNSHYMLIHTGGLDAQAETKSSATPGQEAGQGGTTAVGTDTAATEGTGQPEKGQLELYPGADLGNISLPATLVIDGVERPTANADGQPIAATTKAVTNFWRWFGDSKAVNDDGYPMVFYHGTKRMTGEFAKGRRQWFFFTDDKRVADTYVPYGAGGGQNLAVYLKVDDIATYDAEGRSWTQVELTEPDESDIGEAQERFLDDKMESFEATASIREFTDADGKTKFIAYTDGQFNPDGIKWEWKDDNSSSEIDWAATAASVPGNVFDTEDEATARMAELANEEEVEARNYWGDVEEWQLAEMGYLDGLASATSTDDLARMNQGEVDAVWIEDVEDTATGTGPTSTVVIVYPATSPVKSADQNEGTFDPASTDFRKRADSRPARGPFLRQEFAEVVTTSVRAQTLATLREMGLAGRIPIEIVDKFEDGGFGAYDLDEALILIASMPNGQRAADVRGTTRHEVVHWARQNYFTRTEWSALANWAKNDPELMTWAKLRYPSLSLDEQIEEAVAEGFARWDGGMKLGKTTDLTLLERSLAKLRALVYAIRDALQLGGLTRGQIAEARGILDQLNKGAKRSAPVVKPEFGRKQWKDDLSRQLLSGNLSIEEHNFLRLNPGSKWQAAWHGSPVENIIRFSLGFIGKGEGAQAFGWGLYFAQKKEIADHYRRKLSIKAGLRVDEAIEVNGRPIKEMFADDPRLSLAVYEVADRLMDFFAGGAKPYNGFLEGVHAKFDNDMDHFIEGAKKEGNTQEVVELEMTIPYVAEVFRQLKMTRGATFGLQEGGGRVYKVEVPESDVLLDLDRPTGEQPAKVQAALAKVKADLTQALGEGAFEWAWMNGGDVQQRIKAAMMNDKFSAGSAAVQEAIEDGHYAMATSIYLRDTGIPGNQYFDRDSRVVGEGTRNFVVFDDDLIELRNPMEKLGRKKRVIRSTMSSTLSDPAHPDPGFFRRIHDGTMGLLTGLGTNFGASGENIWENSDNLIDAFRRKVTQKYQQIIKTQNRAAQMLGVDRLAAGMNPMEMITADERGYKMQLLTDQMLKPMAREMATRNISFADLGVYLTARHAPHRNARIARINPEFRDPDKPGSGMTNAEAAQIMADIAADGKMDDFQAVATHIDAMIEFAQQERFNGGLLSQDEIDAGFRPHEFYVPLRGNEYAEAEHEMGFPVKGLGGGFSVKGKESRPMYGRNSMANPEQIAGYVISQAQQAIERSYRNRIGQSMLAMFRLVPDPAFVEIDRVKRVPTWNKTKGQVEYQNQTRITDTDEEARTIYVKENGETVKMTFVGSNASARRFVKAAKSLDVSRIPPWLGLIGRFTRIWSKSNTQWNPDFILANAVKDMQTGVLNASTLNAKTLRRNMVKNLASLKAFRGAWKGARKDTGTGIGSGHPAWEAFAEFEANGGKLNYGQMSDVEDAVREAKRELKRATRSAGNPVKIAGDFVQWLDNANSAVENMTRLAAYMALRDMGIPAKQAAEATRELTTNFTQHGEWGPMVNAAYGFANASIIGGGRFIKTVATKPQIAGGLIILGVLQDALNSWFDEEEWDKWTEEDKHGHFILPLPDWMGFNIKVPAGYGLNAFLTTGRKASEYARGKKNKDGTPMGMWDAATDVGMGFINAFSPISGATGWNIMAPTVFDPFVNIYQNQNNWGSPIMPPPPFREEQKKPDSQLAFDNTSQFWKTVATAVNEWGGGNSIVPGWSALNEAGDISPESIKHVVGETVGGAGRTMMRALALPGKLASGEIGPNDVPIARRFIGNPYGAADDKGAQTSLFYDRLGAGTVALTQAKKLNLTYGPDRPEYADFYDAHKPLLQAEELLKGADKALDAINAGENAAEAGYKQNAGLTQKRQRTAIYKATGWLPPLNRQLTRDELDRVKAETRRRKEQLAQDFNARYKTEVMEAEE